MREQIEMYSLAWSLKTRGKKMQTFAVIAPLTWISRLTRMLTAGLALILATPFAQAVDTPSSMIITGTISSSSSTPAVAPAKDDIVLVINPADNKQIGGGSVLDTSGTYAIEMSQTSSFNGTNLTLRLKKGGTTYALLGSDGSNVIFPYSGGLFPSRLSLSPTIGGVHSGGTSGGGGTPTSTEASGYTCADTTMDVNGDGACDEKDIDAIRQYIAGVTRVVGKRDVNSDGIVNTRDMINAIRSIRLSRPLQQRR
jgi:hypothetical protein